MSIGILAAKTGNGHISVMNALKHSFTIQGYDDVECFPSFYEDMMICNRVLSGFYNFLMVNSIPLCEKYCEYTFLTRYDLSKDFYEGVHDYLVDFIQSYHFDILISVSHTINYSIIKVLEEMNLSDKIKFYIVVTDPYDPITVGYAVDGADKYYCANQIVKEILLKNKIKEEKIVVSGYPVNENFFHITKSNEEIYQELHFNKTKKTILLNSSAQGIYYYFDFLKLITTQLNELQVIMICGRNEILYQRCYKLINRKALQKQVQLFGFVNNIQDYISISDIVLTKPGANSLYEALYMKKLLLIDAVNGFLFQEKGVCDIVNKFNMGKILTSSELLVENIQELLGADIKEHYEKNIEKMRLTNGSRLIVSDILENLCFNS